MRQFLRDYGFAFMLFGMFLLTTTFYWHQSYAFTRQEAEAHGQVWTEQDQRTEFWEGVWENDRSEYEQLFVQFVGMVAFARWIAYKTEKTQDEVLEEVKGLRRMVAQLRTSVPSAPFD